jgi:hypothetical protein
MPASRRLLVEPWGAVIEVGAGIQHRVSWSACVAVLHFPDRLEFALDAVTSVVIRESDWVDGDVAVRLLAGLAPESLYVEFDGEPEPAPIAPSAGRRRSVPQRWRAVTARFR